MGELIFLVLNNESGILQTLLLKLFHKEGAQGSILIRNSPLETASEEEWFDGVKDVISC